MLISKFKSFAALAFVTCAALVVSLDHNGVQFVSESIAQEAPAPQVFEPAPLNPDQQQEGFTAALFRLLPMMVICYFIFYFMVIRPQDKKSKEQKGLMDTLKRGDNIVTTGGVVGKFSGFEKDLVLLEIAPNVRLKLQPGHISGLYKESQKVEAA